MRSTLALRAALLTSVSLAGGGAFAGPAGVTAAPAAPLTIAHKDVACVVAGRYPRLEACFAPADAVARARVDFRADEKGLWYAVDMTRDGPCYSALLPKPTEAIGRFQYFVEAIDRSFVTAMSPGQAPGSSYAPRVVRRQGDCGPGGMVATSQPTGSVVVSVARDAAGKVVQATAQAAGTPASISGFSMDGVTVPGTGASAGSGPSTGAGGVAGTGIGVTALAIGGGVVAAGAVVAVAASGGGNGASPSTPDAGLTGRWTGTSANGGGLTEVVSVEGASCTWVWDLTLDLVQSGTSLGGTIAAAGPRTFSCSFDLPSLPPGSGGTASLSGTVSGSAVTFQAVDITFTGTRSGNRLSGTATSPSTPGGTITWTWSASR